MGERDHTPTAELRPPIATQPASNAQHWRPRCLRWGGTPKGFDLAATRASEWTAPQTLPLSDRHGLFTLLAWLLTALLANVSLGPGTEPRWISLLLWLPLAGVYGLYRLHWWHAGGLLTFYPAYRTITWWRPGADPARVQSFRYDEIQACDPATESVRLYAQGRRLTLMVRQADAPALADSLRQLTAPGALPAVARYDVAAWPAPQGFTLRVRNWFSWPAFLLLLIFADDAARALGASPGRAAELWLWTSLGIPIAGALAKPWVTRRRSGLVTIDPAAALISWRRPGELTPAASWSFGEVQRVRASEIGLSSRLTIVVPG